MSFLTAKPSKRRPFFRSTSMGRVWTFPFFKKIRQNFFCLFLSLAFFCFSEFLECLVLFFSVFVLFFWFVCLFVVGCFVLALAGLVCLFVCLAVLFLC